MRLFLLTFVLLALVFIKDLKIHPVAGLLVAFWIAFSLGILDAYYREKPSKGFELRSSP